MAIMQSAICFITAFFLGLSISVNVLMVFIVLVPASILFIAIGLLAGSLLTDKQVGGICGALLTNLAAWLSGTWFDLNLVGGAFKQIAYALPFVHAVDAGKAALEGNYGGMFPHLWWVMGYATVIFILAILVFSRKMKGEAKVD
jgi:ABC-2 type transport system permease protein